MSAKSNRLFICALGASRPGTMGGNTKIAIEMARCLAKEREVHVFLPRHKLATFTDNLPADHGIAFHTLDDFPKDDKFHPFSASKWYHTRVRELFRSEHVGSDDFVFGISDFHIDVLPLYPLQKEFGFKWLPSVFLFVPFITENLIKRYRFPAIKYLVYWFYQRALFFLMKRRATGFVVTNRSDFVRFPRRFSGHLFAYYGGVNVEQIPATTNLQSSASQPRVVFCSRLHPQKGIDAFLDIWRLVVESLDRAGRETRDARRERSIQNSAKNVQPFLSVIGNGEPSYEEYLKAKARRLGIADSIEWLGYVNNEAKYRIYAESALLVHPTVFDNNGMVAAEALCTGLPVVMQDLPALRDVYRAGCVKVPFGDRRAFAEAIVKLLTDPGHRAAVAPATADLAALRGRWRWETRAAEFSKWLNSL